MKGNLKLLIYGGSFDPPHSEHAAVLGRAVKALKPGRVVLVPSWKSPFKKGHWASFTDRRKMLELMLSGAGLPRGIFRISDFEFRRKRKTYAYQIVSHYRGIYPSAEIVFLMGSDCLNSFSKWKRHREILAMSEIAVAVRKGYPVSADFGARVIPGIFRNISSTDVRTDFILSSKSRGALPSVAEYAKRKGLYLCGAEKKLKSMLSPGRMRHSLSVAANAVVICRNIPGMDASEAAAAGLLHDCARDLPLGKLLALSRRIGIPGRKWILKNSPELLHSWVSAFLAEKEFGVSDADILRAIKNHTGVCAGMSPLDKVIFVCDVFDPLRGLKTPSPILADTPEKLEEMFRKAVRNKIEYLKSRKLRVYPGSVKLWKKAVS